MANKDPPAAKGEKPVEEATMNLYEHELRLEGLLDKVEGKSKVGVGKSFYKWRKLHLEVNKQEEGKDSEGNSTERIKTFVDNIRKALEEAKNQRRMAQVSKPPQEKLDPAVQESQASQWKAFEKETQDLAADIEQALRNAVYDFDPTAFARELEARLQSTILNQKNDIEPPKKDEEAKQAAPNPQPPAEKANTGSNNASLLDIMKLTHWIAQEQRILLSLATGNEDLRRARDGLLAHYAETFTKFTSTQKELKNVHTQLLRAQKELASTAAAHNALKERSAMLEKKLNSKSAEMHELTQNYDREKQKMQDMEQQLQAATYSYQVQDKNKKKLVEETAQLEASLSQKRSAVQQASNQLDQIKPILAQAIATLPQLLTDMETIKNRFDKAKTVFNSWHTQADTLKTKIQADLKTIYDKYNSEQKQLADIRKKINDNQNALTKLEGETAQRGVEKQSLTHRCEDLKKIESELRKKTTEYNSKLIGYDKKIEALSKRLAECKTQYENCRPAKIRERVKTSYAELQQKFDEKVSKVTALRAEYRILKPKIKDAQTRLDSVQFELLRLSSLP